MGPEVLVMSLRAWESLSAEDQEIFRDAARKSSAFMRELWAGWEQRSRQQAQGRRQHDHRRYRSQAVRARDGADLRQAGDGSGSAPIDRANSPGSVSFDLVALNHEPPTAPGAPPRRSLDPRPRASCGRCRSGGGCSSLAALNATVAVILAALIWNGANVLSARLGRGPPGARIRQAAGPAGERGQPAAEPHPPLHQPAEPGGVRRDPAAAWRGAEHACATAAPSIRSCPGRPTSCAA